MLDPLSAIGLAASIVQFVDYSTELIKGSLEKYRSVSGATEENESLEIVIKEMKVLSLRLLPIPGSDPSEDEKAIRRVAAECRILSGQILDLLEKVKAKNSKSKIKAALFAAIKGKFYEAERLELERRLANCRSQLELQLSLLSRSNILATSPTCY
jgi:pyruvate-formate lyase-activating enzyme